MNHFNALINQQMKTMEKLLYIQAELERCQEIEAELQALQKETELLSIQKEILQMKKELKKIHEVFERQTEEVIESYQNIEEVSIV
ncbi:MAG: YgaB family protein [Bacillota bacterium]|nr:YgaB family protein [Bacillota bacterium]